MQAITTIGLDIAKSAFQVHGIDLKGKVIICRQLILTNDAEIEQWMTAPAEETLKLQRPLPDRTLKVVATGEKEDQAA